MKINRSLLGALLGAVFLTGALAQTEADIASLLLKAQRGNSIAQYNLGRAYASGKGVAADPVEAYVWLSLAYENGFRAKALGNVAGSLDPAQLEIARQRLVERRASLNAKPAPARPANADGADADAGLPVVRTEPAAPPAQAATSPAPVQNPNLPQELATAVADKKELSSELSKSWSETETLKKQLAETQATADFLTAETAKLHAERDSFAAKLNDLSNENASLRSDRDRARNLGEQTGTALALANSQKTTLETSLRTANESAAADKKWLGDELAKAFHEVTVLKARLAEQAQAVAAAPAAPAYPDLTGKVRELEASLAALSAEANSAKKEAVRLADDRLEREKQFAALQQQSAALAAAHSALQQEAEGLRRTAAAPVAPAYPDLRAQVATLENQLKTLTNDANRASEQMAALAQAKATAEKSLAQRPAAPAYPDLSGRVRELETSLAAQTEAAEKSRAALQAQPARPAPPAAPAYPDLSTKVQELEASLAARSSEAAAAGKAADELRQARSETEQKLAAAEQSRTELAQQFDEFKHSALANQREHLSQQNQVQMLEAEKTALRQQVSADQTRLADLSSQLAASRRQADAVYPTAPSYPDQRARVEQLETELTRTNEQANSMIALLNRSQQEAKAASDQAEQFRATIRDLEARVAAKHPPAPAYPDLREQVSNLEIQLDAARALPQRAISETEFAAVKQELAETKAKLATAVRGYAVVEKERDALASRPAPATAPDQSSRVRELEAQLAAKSSAPAYPDLRDRVATLEAALKTAQPAAPAYPDLREQVSNLEIQLDAARALPKQAISETEFATLKQELADTQEKLATTLRGYTLIEKERDELAAKTDHANDTQSEVTRLTEAYSALQRSTAQNERDLVATRALLQQVQGANTLLAQQNYQLKGTLAPDTARVSPAPAAPPMQVVAAAPAAPAATRRTHVVVAGDTLVKISQRYYGNTTSWQPIYNANRDVLGPNGSLKVGTELRIP